MTVGKFRARYRAISGTSDIHVPRYFAPGGYSKKVLSIAPANLIAYWPLWETSGATADNLEGTAARDGAYTGVTLNSSTGPDGKPVPLFDGTNDYVDIYSASLNTAFSGAEGTVFLWGKVSGVGVWTDGSNRELISLYVDGNNYIFIRKNSGNNTLTYYYNADGALEVTAKAAISETGWMALGLTWSMSSGGDGQVKAYYNGAQESATDTSLGTWAGSFNAARTLVGAGTTVPAAVFSGYLAHVAIWTTPLTAAQMLALATV